MCVVKKADDGSMVGVSEASEIKERLVGAHHRHSDTSKLFCEDVTHGTLYGSSIILATTGIGHDRAVSDYLLLLLLLLLVHFVIGTKRISLSISHPQDYVYNIHTSILSLYIYSLLLSSSYPTGSLFARYSITISFRDKRYHVSWHWGVLTSCRRCR